MKEKQTNSAASTARNLRALLMGRTQGRYLSPVTMLGLVQDLQTLLVQQGLHTSVRYVDDLQVSVGSWNYDKLAFNWFESTFFHAEESPFQRHRSLTLFIETICKHLKNEHDE